ncbi:MAG: PP0621 family protein [Sterolibacterium sp.]
MGSKFLLFVLLGWVVYLLVRASRRRRRAPAKPATATVRMVACARCGLNLPEGESLESGGHYYCGEQHRGLGPLERKR